MKNKIENDINGYIILDKPKNYTSNDCLQVVKKHLHPKKIGHTGTLDVNATGVLVCLLGTATKCQDYLMRAGEKIYDAELVLGFSTDTEDITGNIIDNYDVINIDLNDIEFNNKLNLVISSFIGNYNQIPPMYSAKKVDGKKLINLARKGKQIDRKPCEVKINNIDIKNKRFDTINNHKVIIIDILVSCSKGTYIRTLCKDIGTKLFINSCMGNLRRLKVYDFTIEKSIKLSKLIEMSDNNDLSFVKPCLYTKKESVVTFGKFETLHLGHELIIKEVVKSANELSCDSTVLMIGNNVDTRLITYEQKISKLNYLGVNNILEFPFNDYTKNMDAKTFIYEIIIKQLKAKKVVVGSDCRFGKQGLGDKDFLISELNKNNIEVVVFDKLKVRNTNIDISSTYIKQAYEKGNLIEVNELLGKG